MKTQTKDLTLRLVETAIMLALAVILNDLLSIKWPFGGSITIMSSLPVIIIAYRYGFKWGLTSSLAFSLIELLLGWSNTAYLSRSIKSFVIFILFDYCIAYGVYGLAALFRKFCRTQALALSAGTAVVLTLRFLCHVVSGATIWSEYANFKDALIYSIGYNAAYMVPETVIAVAGALLISLVVSFDNREITFAGRKNK